MQLSQFSVNVVWAVMFVSAYLVLGSMSHVITSMW